MADNRSLLSISGAAERLGISESAVRALDSVLQPIRIGGRIRAYDPDALARFQAERDQRRSRKARHQ